ncbi:MAG: aspartate kinase [Neptunomonas phycophila]|uniref:aspartate kinase n=2 Tax=Neptunomonas phycophila TaxID=1572645 RepID=UPI003B8DB5F1
MTNPTVEKIGGTSMSRFNEIKHNIFLRSQPDQSLYNRVFVVSAYAGITNLLLEHKKTGDAGVYSSFAEAENEYAWRKHLSNVRTAMLAINTEMFTDELSLQQANHFILERLNDAELCMENLQKLCAHGHFQVKSQLIRVREMLASLGEAHSAFNTVLMLKAQKVNARMIDLSGWNEPEPLPFDAMIEKHLSHAQPANELLIVTGYTHCEEGLMQTFDRGYSEMTFAKIATHLHAREAIIHKEYHLSSADPGVVGADCVLPIGRTNYDVADQLSNLGMEAIHPKAARGLRRQQIPLRIKNAFEPEHTGTLITQDYKNTRPCVEIIAGRKDVVGIEVFDQEMLGTPEYDIEISRLLNQLKLYTINKDADANTITYYVTGNRKMINRAVRLIEEQYPLAVVDLHNISVVSAIGSDMKVRGILAKTVAALSNASINIMALHQSVRQVEIQCIVAEEDYDAAIKALHAQLIEEENHGTVIRAA